MSMRAPNIEIHLYMLNIVFISPYPVRNSLASSTISTLLTVTCNWVSNPHSDLRIILNSLESLVIDLVLFWLKYKLLEDSISRSSRNPKPSKNYHTVGCSLYKRYWLLWNMMCRSIIKGILNL
uniref:Uncharacterized protein n=1 Tax=Lotus japonicus TaxID=34305 RepID=I3T437_LOTJA|nr:unknown [Lotus japonicus]